MISTNIMYCYARSGGTIINRCLGSLPDTIVMSEVNEIEGAGDIENDLRTIKDQARGWYGIELNSIGYINNIQELNLIAKKQNKKVIIRDWSFVNFVPKKSNNFSPPNKIPLINEFGGNNEFNFFAVVRNAIDVWLSLEHSSTLKNGDPDLEYLLKFVEDLKNNNIKIFKYEDFCNNPDEFMKELCKNTGLIYSDSYKNYNNFINFNGDRVSENSRGLGRNKITKIKRRIATKEEVKYLYENTKMRDINKILGYSCEY